MRTPESSFSIRVDVTNPGQFFGCCGLLEIAHRMYAKNSVQPMGHFDLDNGSFTLSGTPGGLLDVIKWLAESEPSSDESDLAGHALVALQLSCVGLYLDWWREPNGQKEPFKKTAFKLWAGQQSSIGIYATLRSAVVTLIEKNSIDQAVPFRSRTPLTGRFGFDPGAAWNALDAGFSPNEQKYSVASSPVVELLAAIALQRFRPIPVIADRNAFDYVAWGIRLPAFIAAAAAAGTIPDARARRFQFRIASRGSYRCFTTSNLIRSLQ